MDDSRFDALARALSRRLGRRAILAAIGLAVPSGATAKKRKRVRLGKACDGITDRCTAGDCIDGVCACADSEEPCRGRCVRIDTCCPRRRPRRCGNQCIPKTACCRADNECPCAGGCIRCGQCCSDADCPVGPDDCMIGTCGGDGRCRQEATPGRVCGAADAGVCNASGRCEMPTCASDGNCTLLAGEDSRCARRRCVNGRCVAEFSPFGAPLGNRTVGDCLVEVCDGSGGVATIADNADVRRPASDCPRPWCDDGIPRCA
jgi:hypothetical protein